MRYPLFVFFLLFLLIVPAVHGVATGTMIPSSDTSQEAYRRVAPTLIRAMEKKGLNLGDPVFIRIFKQEKKLEVWLRQGLTYTLFKSYSICHHSGDIGPKVREGDKQSPEGFYSVGADQLNPNSSYHLSFNLGFPNEYDRSHNRTGSLLMIHGSCSSAGCFAMTNFRMDEIYAIVESAIIAGQSQVPIHIFPFKMTEKKMAVHKNSKWIGFWRNLKEGYDYFEGHHAPPVVVVQDKRYQFITFPPLLFGGTLPPPVPRLTVVTMKRKFEFQQPPVPSATPEKRQRQLLAKVNGTTPSAPNLLGQGD